jgi:hypothetical protein
MAAVKSNQSATDTDHLGKQKGRKERNWKKKREIVGKK